MFFCKLIADYYRYAAESFPSSAQDHPKCKEFINSANSFYQQGIQIACEDLDPCNPVRLGITLNLSIFFKEVKNQTVKAVLLTQSALQNAIERIDDSDDLTNEDTSQLMEVMSNNLLQWKAELSEA